MTIAVIDGQGGRMGALLVEAMRRAGLGTPHRVLAIGTNALATSAMLKAGVLPETTLGRTFSSYPCLTTSLSVKLPSHAVNA